MSIMLFSLPVFSQEKAGDEDFTSFLLRQHQSVSDLIDASATTLDLFLAKQKYVSQKNLTELTLYNNYAIKEAGTRIYHPSLGLRLDLPNLQRKWQLKFTTYDVDSTERGVARNRRRTSNEEKIGTSLGFFSELGALKTELRPLLEFRPQFETSYLLKFSLAPKWGALRLLLNCNFLRGLIPGLANS